MDLNPNETLQGFTLLSSNYVNEARSTAHLMTHGATGARLLFLENDDEDKSFSIAFRTPPQDSTGVFHILEHSVLCGSNKFPVKEPFVNLLKTSMQTFLNAMTFPDKTMYPVASTNDQDLLNLSDVYLDAVFHPAILRNQKIFQQEGWHLEVNEEGALEYNGVVFNEMKGALSEPDDVLFDFLQSVFFPDTCYQYESGGEPNEIPELTYQQYINEYKIHYQPANSYIILYGNIDIEPMLSLIDQHLCNTEVIPAEFVPRTIEEQAPVISLGNTKEMVTAPENACCSIAYAAGKATDFTRLIALDTLFDALAGSNEAPLKRILLDMQIADDINASVTNSIAQPFVMVQLRGSSHETAQQLPQIVENAVKQILETGVDPQLIEASLSHSEFVMREYNFGYSDGVMRAMSCMDGWLYDENCPYQSLQYEEIFAYLREHLTDGYFDQLLAQVILENNHVASAEIIPVEQEGPTPQEQKLAEMTQQLDAVAKTLIENNVAELRRMQEQPDNPDCVALLPQLGIADLDQMVERPGYYVDQDAPQPCLYHEVDTCGISYIRRNFNLSCIAFEDLPYVSILGLALGRLNTAFHTAAELDTLVQSKLGNLTFAPRIYTNEQDPLKFHAVFVADASALSSQSAQIALIGSEIMLHTDFSDTARLKDMLTQQRIQCEQNFIGNGHRAALSRATAHYLPSHVVAQKLTGIDFYRFLKNILNNWDTEAPKLVAKLQELARALFVQDNEFVSMAGPKDSCLQYWDALGSGSGLASSNNTPENKLIVPQLEAVNEAFIIPADVSFTAQSYNFALLPNQSSAYTGAHQLASNIASLDYLWNEVRVKGGAYGCGFQVSPDCDMRFYSYRDPRIDETLERFADTAKWLADFQITSREFEGYVVNAVSSVDKPIKPRNLIAAQDANYFSQRQKGFRARVRSELIECTLEELRSVAPTIQAIIDQKTFCTFGNKGIIEGSKADFLVTDLFAE